MRGDKSGYGTVKFSVAISSFELLFQFLTEGIFSNFKSGIMPIIFDSLFKVKGTGCFFKIGKKQSEVSLYLPWVDFVLMKT